MTMSFQLHTNNSSFLTDAGLLIMILSCQLHANMRRSLLPPFWPNSMDRPS
jgi:hypothetical protein